MADITQIQVGSTTYDIRDGKHTIFIVKGTQAASTNLFTGNLPDIDELYEGLMIQYWLPFAGTSSSASLNLTLKNGTTTGAIPMYISGISRITTHQVANSYMIYVYHTITISGTSYTGWWAQRAYDTDTNVTNTLATTTKYYITGTASASTNTGTQIFDSGIYATATAGQLNAGSYKVNEQVTLQWNTTDESLDFVFA